MFVAHVTCKLVTVRCVLASREDHTKRASMPGSAGLRTLDELMAAAPATGSAQLPEALEQHL